MNSALIGDTGFVGGNLKQQHSFTDGYHSSNSSDMRGKEYDLVVCAGVSAVKWKANQEPEEDMAHIQSLLDNIAGVAAKRFVLISTVDVYPEPHHVSESSPIDPAKADFYGKHRFFVEERIRELFPSHLVLRLPGLFGPGIKKNVIFDLLHDNALDYTHKDSVFQFYDLRRLWSDIQIALEHNLRLVNLATEPIVTHRIAKEAFGIDFATVTDRPPVSYDMQTEHAVLFGGSGSYIYSAEETVRRIADFIAHEQSA